MDTTRPLPAGTMPVADDGEVAIVVAGGADVDPDVLTGLPTGSPVFAADSGLDLAVAHGLEVSVLVGDLDSVSPAALAAATAAGVAIERYPADKDRTDLDLALQRVADAGFRRCVVVGGGGGRLSHLLANAALIAAAEHAALDIRWLVGTAAVAVARPGRPVRVSGATGDLVSLLAVGGVARGLSTAGLRWRLDGATLQPGSTRGVSNELLAGDATVTVDAGAVLVVHEPPDAGERR